MAADSRDAHDPEGLTWPPDGIDGRPNSYCPSLREALSLPSAGRMPTELRSRFRRAAPLLYGALALGVLGAMAFDAMGSPSSTPPMTTAAAWATATVGVVGGGVSGQVTKAMDHLPTAPAPSPGATAKPGEGIFSLSTWLGGGTSGSGRAVGDAPPLEKLASFGRYGAGKGFFTDARGLALLQGRYLLVADTGNRRLQLLYLDIGQAQRFDGDDDDGDGQQRTLKFRTEFQSERMVPWGVAALGEGHFLVTDVGTDRVLVVSQDHFGELAVTHAFAPSATEVKQCGAFSAPRGVAVHDATGLVVVAYANALVVLRASSTTGIGGGGSKGSKHPQLSFVGCQGTPEPSTLLGGFHQPMGVAILQDSRQVFVVDSGNYRVQVLKLSRLGALTAVTTLGAYASTGEDQGTRLAFRLPPEGIAVHPGHSTLVVSEPESRSIHLVRWHNHPSQVRSRVVVGTTGAAGSRLRGPHGLVVSDLLVIQCTGEQLTFMRWTNEGKREWL